ncbi:hypothetical protein MTR67_031938 [Solanum verrucosum]|uniref:Uncharacterized protein n=1 Tax=Solanum verrucosum TaxID=315347 RepID=A0AAF0ZH37_SOLVR|nr:hypothetical protein MTR67_031938 [Solanum verrucosum]
MEVIVFIFRRQGYPYKFSVGCSSHLHDVHLPNPRWYHTGVGQGALSIRNLKLQSKALRLKWLWRYSQEPQAYWSKVIKIKYGEEDRWMTKEVNTPYGVSVWRSIRVLWPFMKKHTSVKIGNGHKTSFWKANWLRSDSLKRLFPDLAEMAAGGECG